MKSDIQLKSDVTNELAWDPAINETNMGVMVKEGVVTLAGQLNTFAEKHAVERAVRRVAGVRGIALALDVKLAPEHKRSDSEIAEAAITALGLNLPVPDGKVKVEDGWISITGEVDWAHQLASADQCMRPLIGVKGLTNHLTIRPRSSIEVGRNSASRLRILMGIGAIANDDSRMVHGAPASHASV